LRQLPAVVTRHRVVGLLAVAAIAVSTCTGAPSSVDGQSVVAQAPAALPRSDAVTLPVQGGDLAVGGPLGDATDLGRSAPADRDTTEAWPATRDEPELPDEVDLVVPDLVLRAAEGDTFAATDLEDVRDEHAVAHLAGVAEFDLEAQTPDGEPTELTAFAVDVDDFRPFTPEVTAQTVGVWERLVEGDVLVRHDVAHDLGLELGGTVILRTDEGTVPVRVGAFAANGAPPLTDLLVPRAVSALLGVTSTNTLVVTADGTAPRELGDRLRAATGGTVQLLEAPAPQRSAPRTTGSVTLEPFSYTSRGDGTIRIDPAWVQRNIVTIELPRLGSTRCHRAMAPQLLQALREVQEAGLYDHFERDQFAGCFLPRHILWNPGRGLSMHAWGLAIDFNAVDNAYGKRPVMDPRIVRIFERWGFEWGGDWSTPDGMHFQLSRIVETP
jgi:hypothetical protein